MNSTRASAFGAAAGTSGFGAGLLHAASVIAEIIMMPNTWKTVERDIGILQIIDTRYKTSAGNAYLRNDARQFSHGRSWSRWPAAAGIWSEMILWVCKEPSALMAQTATAVSLLGGNGYHALHISVSIMSLQTGQRRIGCTSASTEAVEIEKGIENLI